MIKRIKADYKNGWVSVLDALPESDDDSVVAYWPKNKNREMVHIQDFFDDITNGLDSDGVQTYTKMYISHGVSHWHAMPEFNIRGVNNGTI